MAGEKDDLSVGLHCHRCGYDLRAHRVDEKCPECGEPVVESQRLAAIPIRPGWGQSDRRWRRRMICGVWILTLLPLVDLLIVSGFGSQIRVPTIIDLGPRVHPLAESFFCYRPWYHLLVFCVGGVLLFSRERGRRRGPLDWTRRWGVLGSYIVLLLGLVPMLFFVALVGVGVSAMFIGIPPPFQPRITDSLARVSIAYLRSGPQPNDHQEIALVAFSSLTFLLACIPLYEAIRSIASKRVAVLLVYPLAIFALLNLVELLAYFEHWGPWADVLHYQLYFFPELLVSYPAGVKLQSFPFAVKLQSLMIGLESAAFTLEAIKWGLIFLIALLLTRAQMVGVRSRKRGDGSM